MSNQIVKVVKSDYVRVDGTVMLGPSGTGGWLGFTPVRRPIEASPDSSVIQTPQEARIIESNSEYAIIEVTCSCGAKSHIQCNYGEMTQE